MATFATYSEARAEAEKKAKEIAERPQVLTARQSLDALAALESLDKFYVDTGERVSLFAAISEYCEARRELRKSGKRDVGEAVRGYVGTVASVMRKGVREAVVEFVAAEAPRTKSVNGERPQLSAEYAYNRKIQLEKFADTFPGTAICDLSKEHLDKFIESLADLKTKSRNKRKVQSAKSRNHYRASIRQFLEWAITKDYLPRGHRLFETASMRPEKSNTGETHFYTPLELASLLEASDETLMPLVAIGGLAGLRTAELLRLDWKDVWRVPGHIEVTAGKSKTRQRRLVEVGPALAAWLEQYQAHTDGKLWTFHKITFQHALVSLCETAKVEHKGKKASVMRKFNGLRHAYCTYHFALHANENYTAQQAGNSPAMIHANYKGLATKVEAEKWFNVLPSKVAKNTIPLARGRQQTAEL
jgi:integrase